MLNKIATFLFIIIFFWVFSYFYWEDFFANLENKEKIIKQERVISWKLKDFSVKKIRNLEETEFYKSDKNVLGTIVHKINKAQKSVYIEVYMLTERKIKFSLFNAQKRWVDVKIILEHSPYLAKSINAKYFKEYSENWINIVWSNAKNYTLNHSKIIIIDNSELIISTGNFTASNFKYNRDLFIFSKDKNVVDSFSNIFNKDFIWEKYDFYDDSLVISPNYSRIKIEKLISSAKENIKIYIPYLKDKEILKLIKNKAKSWIKIKIIMSDFGYENYLEENKTEQTIQVKKINKKLKMHSKAVLVDNKYLFIWSENFSVSSLDKNREMWILLKNKEIIEKFNKLFDSDF